MSERREEFDDRYVRQATFDAHRADPYAHGAAHARLIDEFGQAVRPLADRMEGLEKQQMEFERATERFQNRIIGALLTLSAIFGAGIITAAIEILKKP